MNDGFWSWLRILLFLPEERSTVAAEVDHLHFFVILTTLLASTAIGMTGLYYLVRYRRRTEWDRTPRVVPTWSFEMLVIGVPLGFFLTWFVLGFRQFIHIVTPPPGSMDVYVTPKQWMWEFAYPGGPNAIESLRVPARRPVRLLMTSRDVIHSFFVPEFRVKQDVLPGRYTVAWFEATDPGIYPILCAEYCGAGHSVMRGEVVVMRPEDFDAWMERATRGDARAADTPGPGRRGRGDMVREGRRLALDLECLRCHTIDGTAHIGPSWLGLFDRRERLSTGDIVVVDEAYITESMMDPMAKIVAGYKPVMPTYQGRVDGPDSAAIVEYIKSLRSEEIVRGPSEGPTYEPATGR
jgi:cytochrome c oxidase subunit II